MADQNGTSVRITLGFFEDFPTVAGLLRETGARREGARLFVIDGDMSVEQVAALVRLMEHSRRNEGSDPVKVEVLPRQRNSFGEQWGELEKWWGTVDDWR